MIRTLAGSTPGMPPRRMPEPPVIFSSPRAPAWIADVDWQRAQVHLDISREQIEEAPPYDPATPINREFEGRLHQHYGQPEYWKGK